MASTRSRGVVLPGASGVPLGNVLKMRGFDIRSEVAAPGFRHRTRNRLNALPGIRRSSGLLYSKHTNADSRTDASRLRRYPFSRESRAPGMLPHEPALRRPGVIHLRSAAGLPV